ncbi:metallophosphoesterase [Sulfurimonas sp. MAG313]|nr:metallophosphoesterase [Sulfurimonas sp. MAG313]MDF1881663.1 metallophosphoesterase [Sulfurimonas sp. MAG313]
MKFSLFFLVFLGVMSLLNIYIYKRFFKKLHPPLNTFAFAIPSFLMIGEIFFAIEAMTHYLVHSVLLYYLLSSSIGISFLLFIVALVYDLNLSIFKKIPFQEGRRKFIKIIFDSTMLILAFSYLFKGLKGGLSKPILNTVNVIIKGFSTHDYVILQLSDVHVGKTIKKDFVQDIVRRVNAEKSDIVVITGDLVDYDLDKIKEDLVPLKQILAPTYFILGNHEYFHGASEIIQHIRTLGIHVLLNENICIKDKDMKFNLIGLTDIIGERVHQYPMDINKAYTGINPNIPSIVLAHQPKSILRLDARPCDLMLSGHTHGGQIFPFGLLIMMDQPYLAGLYQHTQEKQIFVSRGAGYWGPPIRVLAPCEISKIVIKDA